MVSPPSPAPAVPVLLAADQVAQSVPNAFGGQSKPAAQHDTAQRAAPGTGEPSAPEGTPGQHPQPVVTSGQCGQPFKVLTIPQ